MIVKSITSGLIAFIFIGLTQVTEGRREVLMSEREQPKKIIVEDLKDKDKEVITPNVVFKNVENEKIKTSFLEVVQRYDVLHPYEITLEQRRIRKTTMQAQPILGLRGIFKGVKKYRIRLAVFVSDSDDMAISDLPADVLTGWFAHELGHIVDYEQYSNLGMIRYGLRYLTSKKFKRQAEHGADLIAIDHGFHAEIIAAKTYILNHDLLGDRYKNQIRRYYMSVEDVEMCLEDDKVPLEPKL